MIRAPRACLTGHVLDPRRPRGAARDVGGLLRGVGAPGRAGPVVQQVRQAARDDVLPVRVRLHILRG